MFVGFERVYAKLNTQTNELNLYETVFYTREQLARTFLLIIFMCFNFLTRTPFRFTLFPPEKINTLGVCARVCARERNNYTHVVGTYPYYNNILICYTLNLHYTVGAHAAPTYT